MTDNLASMLLPILPELTLAVLAPVILASGFLIKKGHQRLLGVITAVGILAAILMLVIFGRPSNGTQVIFGGMLVVDWNSFIFRLVFLVGAFLTALFTAECSELCRRDEFFLMLVISTLGMCLMAASADLIMLFLAVETTAIPLYILAGFIIHDQKSVESGIKYLLFGAMTSAVMLFGFSYLYGFSGTTHLYEIAGKISAAGIPPAAVGFVILLVLAGLGFKVSAAPFHFWAPDVYEGAPTPIAGFLSTASKAAGFAVLLRVMLIVFPAQQETWQVLIAVMAAASMILGNTIALTQKNIKRLLAYSSIAQAGYILIGVAANSELGTGGTIYYLIAYLLTNLAAFGIVAVVSRAVGSEEISSFAGLSRRSPGLAFSMLIVLLSLGGIPPFAGFIGKLLVFAAAVQSGMVWLAVVGALNAVVALYYYLNILKVIYLYRSEDEDKPILSADTWGLALGICTFGVIILGVVVAPGFNLALQAAQALSLAP